MNFSDALTLVKFGGAVARKGWNGRGMFVSLLKGSAAADVKVEPTAWGDDLIGGVSRDHFELGADGTATRLPALALNTKDGILVGWLASQTDLLAEDWVEVA